MTATTTAIIGTATAISIPAEEPSDPAAPPPLPPPPADSPEPRFAMREEGVIAAGDTVCREYVEAVGFVLWFFDVMDDMEMNTNSTTLDIDGLFLYYSNRVKRVRLETAK